MPYTAEQLISLLHLQPHPEGGWFAFRETSGQTLPAVALPGFSGPRDTCSYIYYLLRYCAAGRSPAGTGSRPRRSGPGIRAGAC